MAKKSDTTSTGKGGTFGWTKALRALARGRARGLIVAILAALVLVSLWMLAWKHVRERVWSSPSYWLTADDLEITPSPAWIHTNVAAEVFRDASLERPLSIMDADLARRLADAFAAHPWVANVLRVTKAHPARVKVDLVYRRPVCMVQLGDQLRGVDVRGILLPDADFSPNEKMEQYPRLEGVDAAPLGPAGTRWGDVRVVEGAQIAEAIGKAWKELDLDRIVPTREAGVSLSEPYSYRLFTRAGTSILWGRPPGADLPVEDPAAEKVARLRQYVQDHGALDKGDRAAEIDVRHGLRVSP